MESRKNTESGRKAAESWTGPRTLSPQHIIAFFGDTNYINHAQIRYVCEINHSPSGATRPRVLHFISVYVPIGHDSLHTEERREGGREQKTHQHARPSHGDGSVEGHMCSKNHSTTLTTNYILVTANITWASLNGNFSYTLLLMVATCGLFPAA